MEKALRRFCRNGYFSGSQRQGPAAENLWGILSPECGVIEVWGWTVSRMIVPG